MVSYSVNQVLVFFTRNQPQGIWFWNATMILLKLNREDFFVWKEGEGLCKKVQSRAYCLSVSFGKIGKEGPGQV